MGVWVCVPLICVEDPRQQRYDLISLQILKGKFFDTSGQSIVVETEKPDTHIVHTYKKRFAEYVITVGCTTKNTFLQVIIW